MTDEQYNEELSSLLQQHQQNVEERKRLDQALIDLRAKRNEPTFADLEETQQTESGNGHVKRD